MSDGEVGILNVGAGDTKLVFDKNNPQDMIRAARIVKDMLRRGYALLVEVKDPNGGPSIYQRAYDFDEATCEYIIADMDPLVAQQADEQESSHEETEPETAAGDSSPSQTVGRKRGPKPGTKRVHASTTRTVAVARTAGG
jgi:hypothetical protein